ncbi:MAG: glycosyltransferase family 4 protein [Hyphomonadaceae bacterium]|nr:glycosyltransferase family 4 protein [Hyphomonadaceae bacterium]
MLDLRHKPDGLSVSQRAPSDGLRIAILSYRSDPKVGGQGVYVDYLASALAKAGAKVDVISGPPYPHLSGDVRLIKLPSLDLYAQPNNGHYALRPKHLLNPTDTYEYFGHLSGKFVEPYTFGQRAFAHLKRSLVNYDIVLDNQTLATGITKIATRLGIPLATTIHHPITHDLKLALEAAPDWKHRWLVRRWYAFHHMQVREARKLHTITCPSELAKADIVSEFGVAPERIQPIPLGVDQDTFRPDLTVKRSARRIITTASADTPLKGLHILLEAYHQLLQSHPETELIVIGKLRNGATKRTIRDRQLDRHVQFKSDLSRDALADEFRRASVAVTPSLYEGFGLPAAEAMSCGTPVIVTDGGALPEVAGDAGIIVPKGDAGALAKAIGDLFDDPDRSAAVSAACLKRAQDKFNWEKIAPRYLAFFEQAIADQC